jgi:hypothetical protein
VRPSWRTLSIQALILSLFLVTVGLDARVGGGEGYSSGSSGSSSSGSSSSGYSGSSSSSSSSRSRSSSLPPEPKIIKKSPEELLREEKLAEERAKISAEQDRIRTARNENQRNYMVHNYRYRATLSSFSQSDITESFDAYLKKPDSEIYYDLPCKNWWRYPDPWALEIKNSREECGEKLTFKKSQRHFSPVVNYHVEVDPFEDRFRSTYKFQIIKKDAAARIHRNESILYEIKFPWRIRPLLNNPPEISGGTGSILIHGNTIAGKIRRPFTDDVILEVTMNRASLAKAAGRLLPSDHSIDSFQIRIGDYGELTVVEKRDFDSHSPKPSFAALAPRYPKVQLTKASEHFEISDAGSAALGFLVLNASEELTIAPGQGLGNGLNHAPDRMSKSVSTFTYFITAEPPIAPDLRARFDYSSTTWNSDLYVEATNKDGSAAKIDLDFAEARRHGATLTKTTTPPGFVIKNLPSQVGVTFDIAGKTTPGEPGIFRKIQRRVLTFGQRGSYEDYVLAFQGVCGLLFILVVAILLWLWLNRPRGARRMRDEPIRSNLELEKTLTKIGSDFDEIAFLNASKSAAMQLNEAWLAGDLKSVRHFISGAVYTRFNVQLQLYRIQGIQNIMQGQRVYGVHLDNFREDGEYQIAEVLIKGQGHDTTVPSAWSASKKRRALKKKGNSIYTELWSFVRKKSHAKAKGRLMQNECPNCGKEISLATDSLSCAACGVLMSSGDYDWVLVEISQTSASRNYKRLKFAADIGINQATIEDRASSIFWQWLLAHAQCSPAPLRRDATDSLLAKKHRWRGIFKDAAVGAVHLRGVAPEASGGLSATVAVDMSARFNPKRKPTQRFVTLELSLPANYKATRGLAAYGCEQCGAPILKYESETCNYCQSTLPARSNDWLLNKASLD